MPKLLKHLRAASVARKSHTQVAQAVPMDKERKRKERMGEIKLELHRTLSGQPEPRRLEHASEQDLRQEIKSIASEYLQEKASF